jgi:hypothetical protein
VVEIVCENVFGLSVETDLRLMALEDATHLVEYFLFAAHLRIDPACPVDSGCNGDVRYDSASRHNYAPCE